MIQHYRSHAHRKLGRKAPSPKILKLAPKLSKYIKALPPPPPQAGYITEVSNWPMMLNDSLGDCTCACAGHMIEQMTTYAGKPFTPTDQEILTAYEAVGGYVPGDPSTDNGAVISDVLAYWRLTGIGKHKIVAYASVNIANLDEIRQAIALFGNCYIGVSLPVSAQVTVTGENGFPVWSMPASQSGNGAPGSWGGHAIPYVGYGADKDGNKGFELVSWGEIFDVTPEFALTYNEEGWVVVTQDWIEANGKSPSGLDIVQLLADSTQLQVA